MHLLFRAENEARTRDPNLGKVVLYQLSYFRIILLYQLSYFRIILLYQLSYFRII